MPPPKVFRLTEASPEMLLDMQQRYAALLRDYIALAESHCQLIHKHNDLLDRHYTGHKVTL